MTVARHSAGALVDMAATLGCAGIELRDDLGTSLFDGETPESFGNVVRAAGLRILALAEVKAFNDDPVGNRPAATRLIESAARCGAEGVALIPLVGSKGASRSDQRDALRVALDVLQPVLEDHQMRGLIEPLGFAQSSLRFKADVVSVLREMDLPSCFGLIHDTFHHHLAGEAEIYPELTAIIHISGVNAIQPTVTEMTDAHRVLVGPQDRLGNIAQLQAFQAAGHASPISFEAFATDIHDMTDPAAALAGSIAFITEQLEIAA